MIHSLLLQVANIAGLPGAGTWMRGRRSLGLIQMLIALLLIGGTAVSLLSLFSSLWQRRITFSTLPDLIFRGEPLIATPGELSALMAAVLCVILYLINMLWACTSTRQKLPPLPHSPRLSKD